MKSIVITGANNGIGKALVEKYLANNYKVIGIDLKTENMEKHKKENIRAFSFYQADLSQHQQTDALIQTLEAEQGLPDIWVNNAGVAKVGPISDFSFEDYQQLIEVNLNAMVKICMVLVPKFEKRGYGKIVNISSVAGFVSAPYLSFYCASKHGVIGFSESLYMELDSLNSPIKLQVVCPFFTDTNMIKEHPFQVPKALIQSLEKTVESIVKGIAKDKFLITPHMAADMLMTLDRFTPRALKNLGHRYIKSRWSR